MCVHVCMCLSKDSTHTHTHTHTHTRTRTRLQQHTHTPGSKSSSGTATYFQALLIITSWHPHSSCTHRASLHRSLVECLQAKGRIHCKRVMHTLHPSCHSLPTQAALSCAKALTGHSVQSEHLFVTQPHPLVRTVKQCVSVALPST